MGDFQIVPWTLILTFLLLPLAFFGIFAWLTTSMFRRVGGSELNDFGDGYGTPETNPYPGRGSDYVSGPARDQADGQWRSFSFGPGLKTGLLILGVFLLISLIFAPRFLPGAILFLPLFWVGGWSRTYRPRRSRRAGYGPVEQRSFERRKNF